MFIFAHLGIGLQLAKPFSRGLQKRWLMLGSLTPDIFDKTLYYGLSFITGKSGIDLGLISGTRTFFHTGLMCLIFIMISLYKKNKILLALSVGVFTHLFLDGISDLYPTGPVDPITQNKIALFFPAYGFKFPVLLHPSLKEHLGSYFDPYFYFTEIIGFLILARTIYSLRKKQF